MPGQPGNFDCAQLELIEAGASSAIVNIGESIHMRATIQGDPGNVQWQGFLATNNAPGADPAFGYFLQAQFYTEGMGPGVSNQNLGTSELRFTTDNFTIDGPADSINDQGVHRCNVVATIVNRIPGGGGAHIDVPVGGWVAFNENCVVTANPQD